MPNFIVARPFIYVAGTIINPNQNNPNETTVYGGHNGSMNGLTGHTHSGAVGDGPKISAGGIDLTADYTWTGIHTFNSGLIARGGPVRDEGWNGTIEIFPTIAEPFPALFFSSQTFAPSQYSGIVWTASASGNDPTQILGEITTQPTSAISGDIVFSSNDNVGTTPANESVRIQGDGDVVLLRGGITIPSLQKVIFDDSVGNNFITGTASDRLNFFVNGALSLQINRIGPGIFDIISSDVYVTNGFVIDLSSGAGIGKISSGPSAGDGIHLYSSSLDYIFDDDGALFPNLDPPVANRGNRNSFVKAWAYITDTGVILASYNVASVAHPSTGVYNFTWDTPFASAEYVVVASPSVSGSFICSGESTGASTARVVTRTDTGVVANSSVSIMAIGDQ